LKKALYNGAFFIVEQISTGINTAYFVNVYLSAGRQALSFIDYGVMF